MPWLSRKDQTEVATQGFLSGLFGMEANAAIYPHADFLGNAYHGYAKNELVYACIMEKATSMPEAPLRVYGRNGLGEPREDHPLRVLLANPNPVLSEFELFEMTCVHLDLAGNAFWEVVLDRMGRPVQLWPMRPDLMRLNVDSRGEPHYFYIVGGRPIPVGPILHFRYPNPRDLYFGQAPMRPAMRAVALDNEATDFVKALLQNRAVPGAVVTTQQKIDETQADRLKAKWINAFSGSHRGEPVVFQAGMDVKMLGLNPEQLEFPDLRSIAETRICSSFGVPPILVGAKAGLDRSTFANYAEARRALWEETLMPLQRRVRDVIVAKLLPLTTGNQVKPRTVEVRFDNSGVLALRESEQAIWERANNALRAGAITVADFRNIVGLPPVAGADVFLRPAGVIPTNADGTPVNEPAPPPEPTPPPDGEPTPAEGRMASFEEWLKQLGYERRNGATHHQMEAQ